MSVDTIAARPAAAGTRRIRRALTVLAAAAAALAGWVLAGPVAGIDPAAVSNGQTQQIQPGMVVVASVLAGAGAWVVLALLERLTARPRGRFTGIALVVLLVSLSGPFTAAADTASAVALTGLHLAVAAVLIPLLPATATRNR